MTETAFATEKRISGWLDRVLEGFSSYTVTTAAPSVFALPADSDKPPAVPLPAVSLYLMAFAHPPTYSTGQRLPLRLLQRYLVTTWAADVNEANDLLSRLIFSALDTPELDVTLDPLTPSDWLSFGVAPRPAFILNLPIERVRPTPEIPLVRTPITLQAGTFVPLFGQVLGPGDTPIVGALVDYPSLSLSAHTDRNGRFHFGAVPGEGVPKMLRVIARGYTYQINVAGPTSSAAPVIIRVEFSK